jgi:hypothetical protein
MGTRDGDQLASTFTYSVALLPPMEHTPPMQTIKSTKLTAMVSSVQQQVERLLFLVQVGIELPSEFGNVDLAKFVEMLVEFATNPPAWLLAESVENTQANIDLFKTLMKVIAMEGFLKSELKLGFKPEKCFTVDDKMKTLLTDEIKNLSCEYTDNEMEAFYMIGSKIDNALQSAYKGTNDAAHYREINDMLQLLKNFQGADKNWRQMQLSLLMFKDIDSERNVLKKAIKTPTDDFKIALHGFAVAVLYPASMASVATVMEFDM